MKQNKVTGWTGWVIFAGVLMVFSGILQSVYGIAALFNQNWYLTTENAVYLFDIGTWGWMKLILGILVTLSGLLLMSGNMLGRTMGVILSALGILFNITFLAVTPIWSILGIVMYSLIIYAIVAHGSEVSQLD